MSIFALLMTVGVVAGMVYIPPYFADREVRTALKSVAEEAQAVESNEQILARINQFLQSAKSAHYWVDFDGQHSDLNLQLKLEELTVNRDGNRGFTLEATYDQVMFVPVLKKTKVLTFTDRAESPKR